MTGYFTIHHFVKDRKVALVLYLAVFFLSWGCRFLRALPGQLWVVYPHSLLRESFTAPQVQCHDELF